MQTLKKITVNPELFKIQGSKTRKARDNAKSNPLKIKPLVAPNKLKTKLLNRIKDHKSQEIKQQTKTSLGNNVSDKTTNDEFSDALNYLSDLTKKKNNCITPLLKIIMQCQMWHMIILYCRQKHRLM